MSTASLSLPPIAVLAECAAELAQAAQDAGDTANANALNKAIWYLQQGIELQPTTGGFLIASATRTGTIHRLSTVGGCSCESGARQRPCWHMGVLEIIEAAQQRAVPLALRLTEARAALYARHEVEAAYNQGADDALAAVERQLSIRQRQAQAQAALDECYA